MLTDDVYRFLWIAMALCLKSTHADWFLFLYNLYLFCDFIKNHLSLSLQLLSLPLFQDRMERLGREGRLQQVWIHLQS